jgi:hypothetical protein
MIYSLASPLLGEINVKLESTVMLDFEPFKLIVDNWDADF